MTPVSDLVRLAHDADRTGARVVAGSVTLFGSAGLLNSAASRAFYAMFQSAQVALDRIGVSRSTWSHPALQAALTTELIHRRKLLSASFRDYLSSGLTIRHAADYGRAGIGMKVAQRIVRRAAEFVTAVEALRHGST